MMLGSFPKPQVADFYDLFRDATCDEPWGPSVFVMSVLAAGSYAARVFDELRNCLIYRLHDKKKVRKLEKAVSLLEYLTLCGTHQFRVTFRKTRQILEKLLRWNIGRREGNPKLFKEKLENIITMLEDEKSYWSQRVEALYTEMDMCRFCVEQGIDIGAQNPKTQKSPPMAERYMVMKKAYLQSIKQLTEISSQHIGDSINTPVFNWVKPECSESDQTQEDGEELQPMYRSTSTLKLAGVDVAEDSDDLEEGSQFDVAYTRLK